MIKIFHTADLHLDSPFASLPPSLSEERRAELRRTYIDMMKYAARENVDLVLIPGDLFDSAYVNRDTAALLCEGFRQVGCPVVICPGNHDPYTPDSIYATGTFPSNVYVFSDETPSYFDFPELGVRVWGAAFVRKLMENTPIVKVPKLPEDRINILCQHGDTRNLLSKKCPINPRDIAYRGFTYAALGHIHLPADPEVIDNTTVAYSGCPVGRSFDEPGWCGALLVTVDDGRRVSWERVRFSDKRYMVERLDVTGAASYTEVASRILELISERSYGKETSLRVVLEGEVSPQLRLPLTNIVKMCQDAVAFLELKDRTLPIFDTSYLENDMTLRGAVYRELAPRLHEGSQHERSVAAEALRAALAAIDDRVIFADAVTEVGENEGVTK
ncbi:MAG: DNA repair exonuclease [Clostridia bacterium]|nr:DNA repair exonuclease [Clostridia bacterium]